MVARTENKTKQNSQDCSETKGDRRTKMSAQSHLGKDITPDLDLLLIGKTGMGKSATGNNILGYKPFRAIGNTRSVTQESQMGYAQLENGRMITVVDTPGLADTDESKEVSEEKFKKATLAALTMNPYGYHALLIVLKYGTRLTAEDTYVLDQFKELFGKKFLDKYAIVIMTGGDNFESDDDLEGVTFSQWCRQQTGVFQTIYKEVNGRILLFNNRAKGDQRAAQIKSLVSTIDQLSMGGKRYTNDKFEKARKNQEKKIRDEKIQVLSEDIKRETSIILAQLEKVQSQKRYTNAENRIEACIELQQRIDTHIHRIENDDHNELLGQVHLVVKEAKHEIEKTLINAQHQMEMEKRDEILEQRIWEMQQEEAEKMRQMIEKDLADRENAERQKQKEIEQLQDRYQQVQDESDQNRTEDSSCTIL